MLTYAVVFFDGSDQLLAFEPVMRARFLDVYVLSRLARPNGHERVPVIRCGDRDRIDVLVFEQLTDIEVALRSRASILLNFIKSAIENVFIDVAQRRNFHSGNTRKATDVILTASTHPANRNPHAIIGTENPAS